MTNCSVQIYQNALRVEFLPRDDVIGRINSLGDLFLEWFLFDCSKEQTIQEFLVDEQIDDLFTPEDYLVLIFGDAYLDDVLCKLVRDILPFPVLYKTIIKLNRCAQKNAQIICSAPESADKHLDLLKQKKQQKNAERYRRYYENNKDKINERHRKYYVNNKDKFAARNRGNYLRNRELFLEQQRIYYTQNRDRIIARNKDYYKKNKEKIAEANKQYRINHKSEIAEYKHKYYATNKDKIIEYKREYREKNKETIAQKKKEYRLANREKVSRHKHEYYLDNKDKILNKNKIYRIANKEKIAQKRKEYRLVNREKLILQKREQYQKRLDEYTQKCPVTQFIEYVRQNNIAEFLSHYTVRARGSSLCLSKCKNGVRNCPLCANDLTDEQMRDACPVSSVFQFDNACDRIRVFVEKNKEVQRG